MDRRQAIGFLGATVAGALLAASSRAAPSLQRVIPSSGERIPAIGMGTWITFDVAGDAAAGATRRLILSDFFDAGGRVIDSSPMYGSSERVLGERMPPGVSSRRARCGPSAISRAGARWKHRAPCGA